MAVRITCVSKLSGDNHDLHEAISTLGWINEETGAKGISSRLEIYDFIKNNGGKVYVIDNRGTKAYVSTRENAHGTKFVQSYTDRVWTNNLLSLPNC
jgi:hypothetical protein